MGIAPQRRISKTRKRQRRSHFKISAPGMTICPECGEMKLSHIVCQCGYYDGRLVKEVKVKGEKQEVVEEKTVKEPKKKKAKKGEEE